MNKIGIVALAALFALVLGFGVTSTTKTAHADTTGSVVIGCEFLVGAIDGDPDDVATLADIVEACDGIDEVDALALADALGDEDGTLEVSDFDDIDLDENQIEEDKDFADCQAGAAVGNLDECRGTTLFIVFVDDDEPVTLDAPAGLNQVFTSPDGTNSAPSQDFLCTDAVTDPAITDEDCDNTDPDDGDGVVFTTLVAGTADAGDDLQVNAEQEAEETSQDILVTGHADEVTVVLVKDTIQVTGTSSEVGDCLDDAEVTDDMEVNTSIAKATVIDNDEVELTRVQVVWDTEDSDIADVATDTGDAGDDPNGDTGITVSSEAGGIGAFIVICGGTDTGVAAIIATINDGDADEDDDDADITVVDEPDDVALVAAPAQIACDGTATATVTATVTDADGNNVADGTDVNFSVVALGTANPINTTTTDGVASSTITPLSGATAGVTVLVTAGEAQASIRVDCSLPIPPTAVAPGAATPTRTGTIGGPDTGNGGYLGQDSSAGVPAWALIALALGSVALVGGGVVARRSAD